MKAVLTNRIYLNCDVGSELDQKLCEELTYSIDQQPVSPFPLIIKNLLRISPTVVSIPIGRLDLIPDGYTVVDKRADAPVDIPEPKFTPREDQEKAIQYLMGSGLVNAKPSWGKTIAGLGLAHRLQQKTLIVTTTTTIRDMWIKEVKKWFGFEPGIVGGGKYKTDAPIVVGNIQTIRNKASEMSDMFGLVIIDEVHRSPAKTFTDTLNTIKSKYKVGLSGTLERKDGLHCVLPDYFGKRVYIAKDENRVPPTIHLWDVPYKLNSNEFIPWSKLMTDMQNDQFYRDTIVQLANLYADAGHKVLILSDRTDMLEYCHIETEDRSLMITGKIKDQRDAILNEICDPTSKAKMLWGTQSIFSEGVSAEALSCVILATPINNEPLLEQIIGRVMRKAEGKKKPIVVDIGLQGNTGKRHRRNRLSFYINMGWAVQSKGEIN